MTIFLGSSFFAGLAAVLGSGPSLPAGASCTPVRSLFAHITRPGLYCVTGDLVADPSLRDAGIRVSADFVTLDLGGFTLNGRGSLRAAIEAHGRREITVRNGMIQGFAAGVVLSGSGAYHVVEGLRVERTRGPAIRVEGRGSSVRRNRVLGGRRAEGPWGITVRGALSRVLENTRQDRLPAAGGPAIQVVEADGAVIEANRVSGPPEGSGALAVEVASGEDVLVVDNDVADVAQGIVFEGASGKYAGNIARRVPAAYRGGIDAGNNE